MAGKKVLVVKQISHEGPGIIRTLMEEYGVSYEVVDLARGEDFPSPKVYDAIVVLGGPDSANDETDKITGELGRIREALEVKIPYLGICLGLQLLVKASGGKVVKSAAKEVAFRDPAGDFFQVELTPEGKKDPLFGGIPSVFTLFHLHGETVVLTKEMTLLGKGKWCTHQAVKIGKNAYGIQGHLELTPEMLEVWMAKDPDLLKMNRETLRKEFRSLQEEYVHIARRLFANFLHIAHLLPQAVAAR